MRASAPQRSSSPPAPPNEPGRSRTTRGIWSRRREQALSRGRTPHPWRTHYASPSIRRARSSSRAWVTRCGTWPPPGRPSAIGQARDTGSLAISARLQPLRAEVTVHVLHRSLDDLAPVRGGVNYVAPARVYGDVGYDPAVPFLEEHQIAGAKVSLRDLPTVLPLLDRVVGQPPVELPEDHLRVAGAVFLFVGLARIGRRTPVAGAYVPPCHPHHIPTIVAAAPRHQPRVAARSVLRGGYLGASDDHHGVGDYPTTVCRVRRDLHRVAVTRLHLVLAEPDPHAPLLLLVNFGPLDTRDRADAEAGRGAVALPDRPPGVDGVVIGCGDLHLELRGTRAFRRLVVVPAVIQRTLGASLPALRRETLRRCVVDDLRIGLSRLHSRKLLRRRMRPTRRTLGDRPSRNLRRRRLGGRLLRSALQRSALRCSAFLGCVFGRILL